MKIALCEDELLVAMDLEHRLESSGHHVVASFDSGPDIVEFVSANDIDVVLMDVRIAGPMDGIETMQAIQRTKPVPAIYMTAFADEELLARARSTLMKAWLEKPVDTALLLALLGAH